MTKGLWIVYSNFESFYSTSFSSSTSGSFEILKVAYVPCLISVAPTMKSLSIEFFFNFYLIKFLKGVVS